MEPDWKDFEYFLEERCFPRTRDHAEEILKELVSSLLGKSSLSYPFVAYQPVQIEYKGQMIRGCVSRDFLKEGEILIPLEKLYRRYTGESLTVKLAGYFFPPARFYAKM